MTYTNNFIESAMERFSDPHFAKVDITEILAFIGLLYLRTAFRLILRETLEIWNYES